MTIDSDSIDSLKEVEARFSTFLSRWVLCGDAGCDEAKAALFFDGAPTLPARAVSLALHEAAACSSPVWVRCLLPRVVTYPFLCTNFAFDSLMEKAIVSEKSTASETLRAILDDRRAPLLPNA